MYPEAEQDARLSVVAELAEVPSWHVVSIVLEQHCHDLEVDEDAENRRKTVLANKVFQFARGTVKGLGRCVRLLHA